MKYFLHDSNSFHDEKISELFIRFGYEGLGLFYTILEKISAQEKPIKTSVLKHQLFVGKRLEKCWSFMEEIGVINKSNGETFNERILSYSETYQIKKEKNRERISKYRENQQVEKNVTHTERVSNAPKVKRSKVNRIEVNKEESKEEKPNTKKRSLPILFRESEYYEKKTFSEALENTDYQDANCNYYHEVILNWSDSNNEKKINWLAAAKNWMARDMRDGKFITTNFNLQNNGTGKGSFKKSNSEQMRDLIQSVTGTDETGK